MPEQTPIKRKVFLSYAHTSDDHCQWVLELATSLKSDGVEVILDRWHLREGQDANHFMEQMVSDESIDRVLMVSDKNYAAKADNRKGGVGTESQIISQKLYQQVGQTKFVAILRERDEHNQACLPVFYGSRIYIDMCDPSDFNLNYERLVRYIFDKPLEVEPPLGNPPAYITNDGSTRVTCLRSSRQFKEVLISGRGNPTAAFQQFANDLICDLENHRLTYDPKDLDAWPNEVLASIEALRHVRDPLISVMQMLATSVHDTWLTTSVVSLLEQIAKAAKASLSGYDCSGDNILFFSREAFLSTIAVLIKNRRYTEARKLFEADYFVPERSASDFDRCNDFEIFDSTIKTLDVTCNQKLEDRWISYTGHLIFQRASHPELPVMQLIQADAIALLIACSSGTRWTPTVSLHSASHRRLPLCDAMVSTARPGGLGQLLDLDTTQAIVELIGSEDMLRLCNSHIYWRTCYSGGGIYGLEDMNRFRR